MSDKTAKKVDSRDSDLFSSPIVEEGEEKVREAHVGEQKGLEGRVCYWNGVAYSPGAEICETDNGNFGNLFKCMPSGNWLKSGYCKPKD